MEFVIILAIELVLFPIVYISANKWHMIAEKWKKIVGN